MEIDKLEPKEIVKKMMDYWRAADLAGVASLLSEDCTWEVMCGGNELLPNGSFYRGKQIIIDELLAKIPDLYHMDTLEIRERAIYIDGETAIIEFQNFGKTKAGKVNDGANYAWVFRIEDGKIIELREYIDSLKLKAIFT